MTTHMQQHNAAILLLRVLSRLVVLLPGDLLNQTIMSSVLLSLHSSILIDRHLLRSLFVTQVIEGNSNAAATKVPKQSTPTTN